MAADGALQHVPFSMLPEPGSTRRRPLVAVHELVILPSASTLAIMRKDAAARPKAVKLIAVLADPVFGKDDPRAGDKLPPASNPGPAFSSTCLKVTQPQHHKMLLFHGSRSLAKKRSAFLPLRHLQGTWRR